MIGRFVLLLFGAVSLASAKAPVNCTVPTNIPEGCAACYRCEVEEKTTDVVLSYTLERSVDLTTCRKRFSTYFNPSITLCKAMNFYKTESIPVYKKVEVCQCDPSPVMQRCLDSNQNAFIMESPKTCSQGKKRYPSNIVCHWNLPQADQVYMHLLKQDIEGNPNDGALGCKDKLVMKSESWDENLVTCGNPPTTRPAGKIYNSIHSETPSVFFYSDDMEEGYDFQILFVYLSRKLPSMNIRGNAVPRGSVSNSGRRNTTAIDVHSQPAYNPFTTCCECPEINITELCPNGSLERNIYYQKLSVEISNPSSSCTGMGKTGFSGLKGCIGAEFLSRGIPLSGLTEEECENMKLGMTDWEAAAFMDRGSSLWCDCSLPSSSTFCMDDIPATRPNAEELIKLEKLLAGFEDPAECSASDNAVLRSVANFLLESQRVPVLKLSDDSHC